MKMFASGDEPSRFEVLDWFYQILKRTMLGLILCHGLVLDVGCGEGSFPKRKNIAGLDVNKGTFGQMPLRIQSFGRRLFTSF